MMFGSREHFKYVQCSHCECLQIAEIPTNLAAYYPENYSAHKVAPRPGYTALGRWARRQYFRNALFGRGHKVAKLIERFGKPVVPRLDWATPVPRVLSACNVKDFSARFLDVGCGSWSKWLQDLYEMGFRRLIGIDPYIRGIKRFGPIQIRKASLRDIGGAYEVISFHHSLEHIPDQVETLLVARALLAPEGRLLVRIPTVSSRGWKEFGTDWVEMDAPRHLYLHSRSSIVLAARAAKLKLIESFDDTYEFEFAGSAQYRRGIPLNSPESFLINPPNGPFSDDEWENFRQQAAAANINREGGRIALIFARAE